MTTNFYREDYPNAEYVELEKYGVIKLSDLPIVLDRKRCHQLEWCSVDGKRAICESSGCQPMFHGGGVLNVLRVIEGAEAEECNTKLNTQNFEKLMYGLIKEASRSSFIGFLSTWDLTEQEYFEIKSYLVEKYDIEMYL